MRRRDGGAPARAGTQCRHAVEDESRKLLPNPNRSSTAVQELKHCRN
jgi:hypothetical protein